MISEYEDKNEPVVVDMLTQKLSVLMKDAWMIKADLE
jgi:DNA-binding ferritin-like protein